jgi:shikimate dehydrogenase
MPSLSIDGKTRLTGIIGQPVSHSLSPAMHNLAFDTLNLNYTYVPLASSEENLSSLVSGLKAINFAGANVTIPHKSAIIPHLDKISEIAKLCNSVNTLYWEGDKLCGTTTDGYGFIRNLKENGFDTQGKSVVLLGYGGSGHAVAHSLILEGGIKSLTISGRNKDKVEHLIQELKVHKITLKYCSENDLKEELVSTDLLINSTPIGMHPNIKDCSINPEYLHSDLVVTDLIYTPLHTQLLIEAKKVGCKAIPGLGMLLWQGVKSFEIWTGKVPPADKMRKLLEEKF